jgi:CheY-like chemotaxis protein
MAKTNPGVRVLVVDDNKPHCYVLARMLESAGYLTVQAYNGKDSVALAAQKPDLIILDLNLPDLHGFEVARRLRNDAVTAAIPIIFMSGTDLGAAAKIQDAEVQSSGFLTQPLEPPHLLAVVRGALAQNRGVQKRAKAKRPRRP